MILIYTISNFNAVLRYCTLMVFGVRSLVLRKTQRDFSWLCHFHCGRHVSTTETIHLNISPAYEDTTAWYTAWWMPVNIITSRIDNDNDTHYGILRYFPRYFPQLCYHFSTGTFFDRWRHAVTLARRYYSYCLQPQEIAVCALYALIYPFQCRLLLPWREAVP